MSQQKPEQTEGGGQEQVKQELRGLRKVQAPWYFESRLQQRLRMGDQPRSWMARPVPAFALSLLAVAMVGTIGYYVYVNSEFASSPLQKAEEPAPQPEVARPSVNPPLAPRQEVAPLVVPESAGGRQQGPSESADQRMRSTLQQRYETEPRPSENVVTKPSDEASLPPRGSMTSGRPDTSTQQPRLAPETRMSGVATYLDSAKSVDTSSARKDTTKARRDSLHRIPDNAPPK